MKKLTLTALSILIWLTSYSQNMRVVQDFEKIPMSGVQFEVEGIMSKLPNYKLESKNNTELNGYTWKQYLSTDKSRILLCFYKGILYLKRLNFYYSLSELESCKIEYSNLKEYIASKNKIVQTNNVDIKNEAYGGIIGYGTHCYINTSSKNYVKKTAEYKGVLSFSYDEKDKRTTTLSSYCIEYEHLDLSKTDLNADKGYTTF